MKYKLLELLKSFKDKNVMVIGDLILDDYWYGDIKRISREAPVLILEHEYSRSILGGAANAVSNIKSLGSNVVPISIVANDKSGEKIRNMVKELGIDNKNIVVDESGESVTPTKIRVMGGVLHTSKQQTLRIDKLGKKSYSVKAEQKMIEFIKENLDSVDAVLVSDYGIGVLSDKVIDFLNSLEIKVPYIVDSRYSLSKFKNITVPTPNQEEAEELLEKKFNSHNLKEMAVELSEKLGSKTGFITRGKEGMVLHDGKDFHNIPVFGSIDAIDVTGAGDTVSSVFSVALASGAGFAEAMNIANAAASVVVMKRGNATVGVDELGKVIESVF